MTFITRPSFLEQAFRESHSRPPTAPTHLQPQATSTNRQPQATSTNRQPQATQPRRRHHDAFANSFPAPINGGLQALQTRRERHEPPVRSLLGPNNRRLQAPQPPGQRHDPFPNPFPAPINRGLQALQTPRELQDAPVRSLLGRNDRRLQAFEHPAQRHNPPLNSLPNPYPFAHTRPNTPITQRALERNESVPAFTYAYSPPYPITANLDHPVSQSLEENGDAVAYTYPPLDAPWLTGPYFIPGIRRSFEAFGEAARNNAELDRQRAADLAATAQQEEEEARKPRRSRKKQVVPENPAEPISEEAELEAAKIASEKRKEQLIAQWLNPFQDDLFEDGYHINSSAVPARSQAAAPGPRPTQIPQPAMTPRMQTQTHAPQPAVVSRTQGQTQFSQSATVPRTHVKTQIPQPAMMPRIQTQTQFSQPAMLPRAHTQTQFQQPAAVPKTPIQTQLLQPAIAPRNQTQTQTQTRPGATRTTTTTRSTLRARARTTGPRPILTPIPQPFVPGRPTFKRSLVPVYPRPSSPVAPAVEPLSPVALAVEPLSPVAPPVEPLSPVAPAVEPLSPILAAMAPPPRLTMGPPPRPTNKRAAPSTAEGGEESAPKRRRI